MVTDQRLREFCDWHINLPRDPDTSYWQLSVEAGFGDFKREDIDRAFKEIQAQIEDYECQLFLHECKEAAHADADREERIAKAEAELFGLWAEREKAGGRPDADSIF